MNVRENIVYYIKKNIFIVLVLIGLCPILALSYAKFTINSESYRSNEMYISELLYSIKIDNENTYTIDIEPGETEHTIEITSLNAISTNYKLAYLNNENIEVVYSSDYMEPAFGGILTKRTIYLTVKNMSDKTQTLSLMVFGGYSFNDVNDIKVLDTYTPIDGSNWFYDYETTALYVNNERVEELDKTKYYTLISYTCNNLADDEKVIFDMSEQKIKLPISKKIKCSLYFDEIKNVVTDFKYTGTYQEYTVPVSGYYKLETWGAQGGSTTSAATGDCIENLIAVDGGYGGYSLGVYYARKGEILYVYVGGKGYDNCVSSINHRNTYCNGGFNGGGKARNADYCAYVGSGGGATHIAKKIGLLTSFENNLSDLLIVSGGGGGSGSYNYQNKGEKYFAGNGGGAYGNEGTNNLNSEKSGGGTQAKGAFFGKGGELITIAVEGTSWTPGGGGGLYGGDTGRYGGYGGAGGSGYIGNEKLISTANIQKKMYCYNCNQNSSYSARTESNGSDSCSNTSPKENCAKIGDGYAKITFLSPKEEVIEIENGSYDFFDFSGGEQKYTISKSGNYKLEVWGSQGGTSNEINGGYGGYSKGEYYLNKEDILYINVGGTGEENCLATSNGSAIYCSNGYNGGGKGFTADHASYASAGGGATSIALTSGTIDTLENKKEQILLIAGGGGGSIYYSYDTTTIIGYGGNAGGYKGTSGSGNSNPPAGTQSGNLFGKGQSMTYPGGNSYSAGGGGGFYGGDSAINSSGAGGSGYIGNSKLKNKVMYCYKCSESADASIKTISTTCTEKSPIENCSKQGNGYAKLTYLSE